MAKRILIMVVFVLLLSAIGAFYYIYVYDASKGNSFQPPVDEANLAVELKRLISPAKELSQELLINNKELKAILVIGSGLNKFSSPSAMTIKEIADLRSHGGYYEFPDQSLEATICDIRYTHIKDAFGYGWWSYQGNLYADRYGKEKAKGKPNYRYQVEIFIRNEESHFHILAFCNTDSIDVILNEAINQINAIDQWGWGRIRYFEHLPSRMHPRFLLKFGEKWNEQL